MVLDGVIENWWRQGMMGGVKAHYDGIKAFSETDLTADLKSIDLPTLVMQGEDDQAPPCSRSNSSRIPLLSSIPASRMACSPPIPRRSTKISWNSSRDEVEAGRK
jgi:pimeloyl-ACP methyl ester carboxylesterase